MSMFQVAILVCVALLLAGGQLMLKSAVYLVHAEGRTDLVGMFEALAMTWQFWAAIVLSAFTLLLWSWVLSFVPLSKGYPFVVLAFVFTALFESRLYDQALSLNFFLGCSAILAGLVLIINQ